MSKRKTMDNNKEAINQLSLDLQPPAVKGPRLSVVISSFQAQTMRSTTSFKLLDPDSPEITKIILEKANALGW